MWLSLSSDFFWKRVLLFNQAQKYHWSFHVYLQTCTAFKQKQFHLVTQWPTKIWKCWCNSLKKSFFTNYYVSAVSELNLNGLLLLCHIHLYWCCCYTMLLSNLSAQNPSVKFSFVIISNRFDAVCNINFVPNFYEVLWNAKWNQTLVKEVIDFIVSILKGNNATKFVRPCVL